MKLILRPAIPPWSLIIRKKASEHFAMVPSAETGPLSEVVHPILISVAVTPGGSSAWEARGPATAMAPAAAEPANSERRFSEVICFSPGLRRASASEPCAVAGFSLRESGRRILRLHAAAVHSIHP